MTSVPATFQHVAGCPGCQDYELLLRREAHARHAFYQAGVAHADALAEFRRGVIAYLRARHPLRTEKLKRDGQTLGPATPEDVLLAAMAQWDSMRDAELRSNATRATAEELARLRTRNTELEAALAKHADQRNADQEAVLEQLAAYAQKVEKLTAQLEETVNDRRALAQGFVRLADHITANGGTLPSLLRRPDWYRRWAEPKTAKAKPAPSRRWAQLAQSYHPRWGEPILQGLWTGAVWTIAQLARGGPDRRAFLEKLAEHQLIQWHDPGQSDVATVEDELGAFATEVNAKLGPRRPSAAQRVLDVLGDAPGPIRAAVLRAIAVAGKDHQLQVHPGKGGRIPLVGVKPLSGPKLRARWLVPWPDEHPEAIRDLLARTRAKDAQAGLTIVVRRQDDGDDDSRWGPLVGEAGYDPAAVKRIWLPAAP
ncbi:hypothetical protein JOF53_000043 [Crossiella equi]|uniref:Uncharacterized protein n=1 Tax=Crossiella equi TaxID=130796 RepID=A0ABS5A3L2_9PSEU|nr:hypothetical protein [Crossiella equi]MBP2471171.1 hypothetical protein [Crossiella equi]